MYTGIQALVWDCEGCAPYPAKRHGASAGTVPTCRFRRLRSFAESAALAGGDMPSLTMTPGLCSCLCFVSQPVGRGQQGLLGGRADARHPSEGLGPVGGLPGADLLQGQVSAARSSSIQHVSSVSVTLPKGEQTVTP